MTDSALRLAFKANPTACAELIGIRPGDMASFTRISPISLEAHAGALIRKREFEVGRIIPLTKTGMGDRFGDRFREYAGSFWPNGHRRHVLDAFRFCEYSNANGEAGLNRTEFLTLLAQFGNRRFSLHFVPDFCYEGRKRKALLFLFRSRDGRVTRKSLFWAFR